VILKTKQKIKIKCFFKRKKKEMFTLLTFNVCLQPLTLRTTNQQQKIMMIS